ncbi:MAG: hypothetical protein AAGC72_01880 [Planctomycetota bacterium]
MPSRPDMTVLIRTPGLLLRADVGSGGEPKVLKWRQDWPDIATAAAHAFSDGGKPGKKVWVMDSDVWLGTVDLPAGAVAGQSDKDLIGPAAYEAEALSDLSPMEAVTCVQRRRHHEHGDQFIVTQVRRRAIIALAKAVRSAGAKLAGLGHPAGLPEALKFDHHVGAEGGWRRVEFWYDAIVMVDSVGGRLGLVPLGLGPRSDWRRALTPLLRAGDAVAEDQTLIGPGVRVRGGTQWRESTAVEGTARWLAAGEEQEADEDDGVPTWDLADDRSAERFARSWADQLASIQPGDATIAPTLRPPKAPASRWPAVLVGVLALGLSVYAVVYQRELAKDQIAELQQAIDHENEERQFVADRRKEANQLTNDLRNKEEEVTRLEGEIEKLQRERTAKQATTVTIDRRLALSALMDSLTSANSDAIMIQSIEHGSPRHEITGMATAPEAATLLARQLSNELRGEWSVSPAEIEAEARELQVVWRFTITLEPAGGRKTTR